jgi:hypothetical protein
LRVTYDWVGCQSGDSGALVTDRTTGDPIAMHQGEIDVCDNTGRNLLDQAGNPIVYAFGLCLYQLVAMKSLTLSR